MNLTLFLAVLSILPLIFGADRREGQQEQEVDGLSLQLRRAKKGKDTIKPGGQKKKKRRRKTLSRISGGTRVFNAEYGEIDFQWQATLTRIGVRQEYPNPDYEISRMHICGAVVIDHSYVLTAAHCVTTGIPMCHNAPNNARLAEIVKEVKVRTHSDIETSWFHSKCQFMNMTEWKFGVFTRSRDFYSNNLKYQSFLHEPASFYDTMHFIEIEAVYVPDSYLSGIEQSDIALLRLKNPVPTSIRPEQFAHLPEPNLTLNSGDKLTVSGYGFRENSRLSEYLLKTELSYTSEKDCNEMTPRSQRTTYIFCAGRRGTGSCSGDSGGPIGIYRGPRKPFTVLGLVSMGLGSCRDPGGGIYTDLRYFREFIDLARKRKIEPVKFSDTPLPERFKLRMEARVQEWEQYLREACERSGTCKRGEACEDSGVPLSIDCGNDVIEIEHAVYGVYSNTNSCDFTHHGSKCASQTSMQVTFRI